MPFGCTVDFLPKPESVRAMAKFEPRAQTGMLVGYHLQPGAQWKGEFVVFSREKFVDYDFEHPRTLNELRPIRTLEVKLTDAVPQFMLKPVYDNARRTLNPRVIIKQLSDDPNGSEHADASDDVATSAANHMTDDSSTTEGPAAAPDPPDDSSTTGLTADDIWNKALLGKGRIDMTKHPLYHHFEFDASGKQWAADEHGHRLYRKPLKGTKRPPYCDSATWAKTSAADKAGIIAGHEAMLRARNLAASESTPSSSSTAASVTRSKNIIPMGQHCSDPGKIALLVAATVSSVLAGIGYAESSQLCDTSKPTDSADHEYQDSMHYEPLSDSSDEDEVPGNPKVTFDDNFNESDSNGYNSSKTSGDDFNESENYGDIFSPTYDDNFREHHGYAIPCTFDQLGKQSTSPAQSGQINSACNASAKSHGPDIAVQPQCIAPTTAEGSTAHRTAAVPATGASPPGGSHDSWHGSTAMPAGCIPRMPCA